MIACTAWLRKAAPRLSLSSKRRSARRPRSTIWRTTRSMVFSGTWLGCSRRSMLIACCLHVVAQTPQPMQSSESKMARSSFFRCPPARAGAIVMAATGHAREQREHPLQSSGW